MAPSREGRRRAARRPERGECARHRHARAPLARGARRRPAPGACVREHGRYGALRRRRRRHPLGRNVEPGSGWRRSDVAVLSVARLAPETAIDSLIRAVALAARPHLCLVLAGQGRERAALERLARDLGVRAIFLGNVDWDDIVETYAAADVFALLSRHEPWAVVVNEAAACGPSSRPLRSGRRRPRSARGRGQRLARPGAARRGVGGLALQKCATTRHSASLPGGAARGGDRRGLELRAERRSVRRRGACRGRRTGAVA